MSVAARRAAARRIKLRYNPPKITRAAATSLVAMKKGRKK
jgi:hypothetical protein